MQENIYLRYLGFDLRRTVTPYCSARPNPFLNPIVRRAIHIALDRSSLSGSLDSGASPAWQLVPRSIFGFDPLVQPSAGNPERARELLAEAGYVKGGFQVTLHVGAASREGAKAIAEQLAQIGIEVSVQVLSDAEFFGRGSRGEFTMFLLGYGCAAGDAGQILDDVIHTPDRERSFGFHNWGGYSNAAIDEVIEKIPEAPNAVERQRALQNALAVVMKELPLVPVYVGRDTYAFRASYTYLPRYDGYVQLREIGFASGLEP